MQRANTQMPTARPLWSSPAGKARIAPQLAALLPEHRTYVEPFAGGAAVLYAKSRSEVEVVSDIDSSITGAFKRACALDDAGIKRLVESDWKGSRPAFAAALESKEGDDTERLRKFLYLAQFSFLKGRRYFSPSADGKQAKIAERIPGAVARLRGVTVEEGDYEAVVRKYDGPDTMFFFDPPYVGSDVDVGERHFDEERFFQLLKSLRGKFLLTYGSTGNLAAMCMDAGFHVQQHFVKRNRQVRAAATGRPTLTTYVIANYELPSGQAPVTGTPFSKSVAILKRMPQERYLLGIVLEPDVVDAHGDIYSAESIRKAAHGFMEQHRVIGEMHRQEPTGIKILENYLMPSDVQIGASLVRQGTWMLGIRVLNDDIWEQVQSGQLTGFSVGGYATRTPVDRSISNEVA